MKRTCIHCGKTFHRSPCRIAIGKGKYCSRKCSHEARTKMCTCRTCGKTWKNPISQKGDKFCSVKCYHQTNAVGEYICEICKKKFHPNQKTKSNRFCSFACYWESMRIPRDEFNRNRALYNKKYRQEHPDWAQAIKSRRRALENGVSGHFTASDWHKIKAKQNHKCAACGLKKKLTVDHIIPLARGGSNYPSNIQGLCGNCNSQKWVKVSA